MNVHNGAQLGGPPPMHELKDFPCECGHNRWTRENWIEWKRHVFNPKVQVAVMHAEDKCGKCGAVRTV